jgi:hypothetical protein
VHEDLETVTDRLGQDDFVCHRADLGSGLTALSARVADAVRVMMH